MWSRACSACNCYPKIFGWFLLFNGSIDVPQQTTSKYANQHLKNPKRQRNNSEKTSQVHPSVSHSDFTMFVSNPNFPFFWGGWITSWDLFFQKKTHTNPNTQIHSNKLPTLFPNQTAFPVFPTSRCFPFGGKFGVAQGAKYSKNSSAKKTLLGNSAIMFTWRKKGDYGNYKCKGCEKQTVNIEEIHPCILHVCMYVYIYM